jgi:hypothetical protein
MIRTKKVLLFKSALKLSVIITTATFSCGYGYMGDLPKLGNFSNISNVEKNEIKNQEPVVPLAPKTVPHLYSGVIVNQGKYTQYLKDMDELIPILESMKNNITNENTDIQMFCAKANTIHLHVNALKAKYNNKTEKYYESFKQLDILSKNLVETADYWRHISKYNKLIRGSLQDKYADQKIMDKKLTDSLKALNITLEILKENTIN